MSTSTTVSTVSTISTDSAFPLKTLIKHCGRMLNPTNCILLANGVRYHQYHCQYHQYDTESLPRGKSFQIQNHLLEIFSICFKFLVEFVLSNRFHHILEVLGVVKRGH